MPAAAAQLLHPHRRADDDDPLTEAFHAQLFATARAEDLRYHHKRGVWLFYESHIWRPDRDERIVREAIHFARQRQEDALKIRDKDDRGKAIQFAIRQENRSGIRNIIDIAKSLRPLADKGDGWDASSWLVGAPNGIIDLRTGLLQAGDPTDRISMSVNVPYDETDRECPRWLAFLLEVFDGDQSLIDFVQRYIGYSLTGETKEQVLAVFYGRGANGKSTLLNTISWVLGDYAHNMPFSAMDKKNMSAIPSDVAALDGKRFVTASETNEGTRLNEARIKALTGGDRISARFMHADFFTFQPVAKFVLGVNHRPVVSDDSYGFWRRIRLVPFTRCFSGSICDPELDAKLKSEGVGILHWIVQGARLWQRDGLGQTKAISDATDAYKAESDPLADFIEECCESDVTAVTNAGEVQGVYTKWADTQRIPKLERLSQKDFGRRFAERYERKHTNSGWKYYGVKISSDRLFL